MAARDDQNLGDRIQDIVENAINQQDFERLNRNIRNTIDDVFEEWKIGSGTRRDPSFGQFRIPYEGRRYGYQNHRTDAVERTTSLSKTQLYTRNIPGTFSGPFNMILGGIGVFGFGLTTLLLLGVGTATQSLGTVAPVIGFIMAPMTIASGVLMGWGAKLKNRAKRFKSYVNVLSDRKYCEVAELAAAVDKDESFVVRDLRKMIDGRYFLHGHLDRKNTTLMVDEETYKQYLETDRNYQAKLAEQAEQRRRDENIFSTRGVDDPDFIKAIAEGNEYINEIREANSNIPGEEISKKLYRLEDVLKKIFMVLKQKPDQLGRLRKFMNYYMPTTRKLVQTYQELDSQTVSGENISRAKVEIEQTLDTINDAYEKLLDSFYEDALMDVHTDRAVLENMLTEDGLKDSPFERKAVQQGQS